MPTTFLPRLGIDFPSMTRALKSAELSSSSAISSLWRSRMAIRFLGNFAFPFLFEDHRVLPINLVDLDHDMVARIGLHYFATVIRLNGQFPVSSVDEDGKLKRA